MVVSNQLTGLIFLYIVALYTMAIKFTIIIMSRLLQLATQNWSDRCLQLLVLVLLIVKLLL